MNVNVYDVVEVTADRAVNVAPGLYYRAQGEYRRDAELVINPPSDLDDVFGMAGGVNQDLLDRGGWCGPYADEEEVREVIEADAAELAAETEG